jgi:hypothetical protein
MSVNEFKAVLKATGKEVKVYKHREGGYVDSVDLNTKYKKEELSNLKPV